MKEATASVPAAAVWQPVVYIHPVDPNLCKYNSSHKFVSWGVCRWWHFSSRDLKYKICLCIFAKKSKTWAPQHMWCFVAWRWKFPFTRANILLWVFFLCCFCSSACSLLENMTSVKVAGQALNVGHCLARHLSSFHGAACIVEEEFYFAGKSEEDLSKQLSETQTAARIYPDEEMRATRNR